jgi:hypothetical protein
MSRERPKRSRTRPIARFTDERKERVPVALKGDKLSSLMTDIIKRLAPLVALLTIFLAGCSDPEGEKDPREEANRAISGANDSIAEHNRLFRQAREDYAGIKENIESGDDPKKQKDSIVETRDKLRDARGNLQQAKKGLAGVRELDVDRPIKRYSRLLSQAMKAQLEAELQEIRFYRLLENDPALEERRERAVELLEQAGENYQKAEEAYAKAQDFADTHKGIIAPAPPEERNGDLPDEPAPPEEDTSEETTPEETTGN